MASFSRLTPTYHRDTHPGISPTKPALSQAGKTILVTGGGAGIGFEIARSFAKASASRIIIVGRRSDVLDAAVAKLREEFKSGTEFIARPGDISNDNSIAALWEYLHSQKIFVHVLVLNAAHFNPRGPDTLDMDKGELLEAFNVNVGGNFLMSVDFVKQALRPAGKQLQLVNVSTAAVHMNPSPFQNPYSSSKAAFTALLGRIADERPVEDVQIVSYHPGALWTDAAASLIEKSAAKWDEIALPADFAVWAASPEASLLHGRFVWAHWDVDELRADSSITKRLKEETGFLKVGVQGLTSPLWNDFMNN